MTSIFLTYHIVTGVMLGNALTELLRLELEEVAREQEKMPKAHHHASIAAQNASLQMQRKLKSQTHAK